MGNDGKLDLVELIQWLRDYANIHGEHSVVRANCNQAADELEKMDERIHIMAESMDSQWGREY